MSQESKPTIRGPIISVKDVQPHREFFVDLMDMAHADVIEVPELTTLSAEKKLNTCFYSKPGTPYGIRIWQFDPPDPETIRSESHGTQLDALKVIDFYSPEFDRGVAEIQAAGFELRDAIAEYPTQDGVFREAHLWRPDNVVCAVITGPENFMVDFATLTDQLFSEPQSISAPVSNANDVISFYETVFGFQQLYQYHIENSTFDALVGTEKSLTVDATNMGTSLNAPYLGVIDYGIGSKNQVSLKGRSRPPARGLAGIEITLEDMSGVLKRAEELGSPILLQPTQVKNYPPYGTCQIAAIEAPHGVVHLLVDIIK